MGGVDPISAANVDGRGVPIFAGNLDAGDPISAGNLDGEGDPISAGNLNRWRHPISAGNLDWGVIPFLHATLMGGIPYLQEARCAIPYLQQTWGDPIFAGNLDDGRSHMCRKPSWAGRSHICRKPRWGGGGDPISAGNLDGR